MQSTWCAKQEMKERNPAKMCFYQDLRLHTVHRPLGEAIHHYEEKKSALRANTPRFPAERSRITKVRRFHQTGEAGSKKGRQIRHKASETKKAQELQFLGVQIVNDDATELRV
jgi:hypothetical protein